MRGLSHIVLVCCNVFYWHAWSCEVYSQSELIHKHTIIFSMLLNTSAWCNRHVVTQVHVNCATSQKNWCVICTVCNTPIINQDTPSVLNSNVVCGLRCNTAVQLNWNFWMKEKWLLLSIWLCSCFNWEIMPKTWCFLYDMLASCCHDVQKYSRPVCHADTQGIWSCDYLKLIVQVGDEVVLAV